MPYTPDESFAQTAVLEPPPVEDVPPPAPPPPPAPAQTSGYVPDESFNAPPPQQAAPTTAEAISPAAAPPPPTPVQNAANAVGTFVAQNVVPAAEQYVPQPFQDAVAPRVSGAVGAVGAVGQAAAEATDALVNLDPGKAAGAILNLGNAPVTYETERQGQAAAEGRGLVPSPGEVLADPSRALDVVAGAVNTGPVGQALVGTTLDDYAQTPEGQQAYQAGGGAGLYESWKRSGGIDLSAPPPASLVNPLDDTQGVGDVLGNLPAAAGSVYTAGQKGELNPFLRGMAIDTLNDPSLAGQVALGLASGGVGLAGEAAGRAGLEGTASALGKITAAGRAANRTADVVLDPITNTAGAALTPAAKGVRNLGGALSPSRASREATAAETIFEAGGEYLPTTRTLPPEAPATAVTPGPAFPPSPGNEAAISPFTPQPSVAAPPPPRPRDLFASPVNAAEPIPGIGFPTALGARTAETRPVPGAPRIRQVSPVTGRPIIAHGSRPDIELPLRERLDSLGLSDVGMRLVNDLRDVNPNAGPLDQALYRGKENLVYLSLDAARLDELPRLIDHEAVHALNDLGLFKGREFRTLVRAADDLGLRASIAKRYPELDAGRLDEEMVAELYTRHRAGQKVGTFAQRALDRIGQFLRSFGLSLRDTYPEDVLRRIDSGEVGRRTRAQQASDDAFSRVTAPRVDPATGAPAAPAQALPPRDPGPTPENLQVNTSFGSMSAAHRNTISETLLHQQTIGPRADPTSIATEAVLSESHDFKFGGQGTKSMTVRDALLGAQKDVDQWVQMATDPGARVEKAYDRLGRQFSEVAPGVDPATLAGPANAWKRDLLANQMVEDAFTKALPKVQRATGALGMARDVNESFLNYRRRVGLYNYLNIPRFALQQHVGNAITATLGGKPRVGFHLLTNIREYPDLLRIINSEGKLTHFSDDLQRKIGAGHIKGVTQVDRAALGVSQRGGTPKEAGFWGKAGRILAPDSLINFGKVSDFETRTDIFEREIFTGFRTMNKDLPRATAEWSQKYGLPYTEGQIREATSKFLDRNRTITSGTTGEPHSGLLGRVDTYEPTYSAQDFRTFLREELPKIPGSPIPDPGSMDLLVRRVGADVSNNIKVIQQTAEDEMNRIAFDWKNTNVEEAAQNVFMYAYWMSHAGGLYVKQMLKNPAAFAAYGRMMTDMQDQVDAMDGPPWMKGFFQIANTPGGFSLWLSPFDLFSTLLTFGDWQMEAGGPDFRDLTWLGKTRSNIPFMLNPLVDMVGYATGAFGPDSAVPDLLGLNKFTSMFGDVLNLANANGQLPQWVADAGIGRDAAGNPVPIPLRPLDELYGRFANGLSESLKGITGLKTVPVPNVGRSQHTNLTYIIEQNVRIANPSLEQAEVNRRVADTLRDPGSAAYRQAYRQLADIPYMTGGDTPNLVGGLLRSQSPVQTMAFPEQRLLDSTLKGLQPGGNVPPRNLPPDDPNTTFNESTEDFYTAKDTASRTQPAIDLAQRSSDFYDSIDQGPMAEIAKTDGAIYYANQDPPQEGSITIGGVEYQWADLATYDTDTLRGLSAQYLADNGTNWDEVKAAKDQTSAAYDALAESDPVLSGYFDMKSAAKQYPGGPLGYVQDMMATNPAYNDYVLNHALKDGAINTGSALSTDGYLASLGVPPSIYDSVVPPPTSTPNPTSGQVQVTANQQVDLMAANDPTSGAIGQVGPGFPLKVTGVMGDWTQVEVRDANGGGQSGWVPTSSLQDATGQPPQDPTVTPPSGITGGLGALTQGGLGALGGIAGGIGQGVSSALDAAGSVVGTMVGGGTTPTKPASSAYFPGYYDVVQANDGMGVQSTIASDRTWMEDMVGQGHAKVNTEFKGPEPSTCQGCYGYQEGHGAATDNHAAYDIGCDSPDPSTCPGTPIYAPLDGVVACAGYGNGTSAMPGETCYYSANMTNPNNDGSPAAHTVTIVVGQDVNGNDIELSFNHMGSSDLQPGQQINAGDLIGGMGNTDGGPHVHLQGNAYCPATGTYVIVDPQLVVGGYYASHPVC